MFVTIVPCVIEVSLSPGGGTEEATTRTQLNHFSVAALNNGPVTLQSATAPVESMALLTTTTTQEALKAKDAGEISIL